MRSKVFVTLGLAGIMMIAACSSSVEEKPKAQTNPVVPGSGSNSAVRGNEANSNAIAMTNGMVVPPEAADANSLSTAPTDQLRQPTLPGRLGEKMQQMKTDGGNVDPATLAMKNARPAPDNSTFTSYLTDAGYEIRTFKNHPQLLKAEKRIESNGNQSLKIFLRNGSVVQLPGLQIATLSNASADAIAAAAGINTAPVKQAAPGSTGAKKPGN